MNLQTKYGEYALLHAYQRHFSPIVDLLLLKRPEIDVNLISKHGLNPVFLASEQGDSSGLKKFLSSESFNANIQNEKGDSLLYLAAKKGHVEIVNIFFLILLCLH